MVISQDRIQYTEQQQHANWQVADWIKVFKDLCIAQEETNI